MTAIVLLLTLVRWPVSVACRLAAWSTARLQTWSSSLYALQMRIADGGGNEYEEHRKKHPREKGWAGFRNVSDDADMS